MDERAFGAALVAERKFLVNFARKKHRFTRDQAEDAAQEAIVRAWSYKETYVEQENLRAWLLTIMRNWVFSEARRGGSRGKVIFTDDAFILEKAGSISGGQFESMYLHQISEALGNCSPDQIEALLLITLGHEYEEAGRISGIPGGTVKSRVARGRQALRKMLGEEPVVPVPEAAE